MGYIITLIFLLVFYILGIYLIKYIKCKTVFNILFPFAVWVAYLSCVISMGIKAGVTDWNFLNTLPTANVSPFMYCLTALIWAFPKKCKTYLFGLVALLSLGMLCAGMLNCIFNVMRNYKYHWEIGLDTFIHGAISWFGVYLVKTEQVDLGLKTALVSGSIIVGVACVMLLTNLLVHTSFFGLSLYGNHNIYNMVLCENGYLSAGIYFIVLSAVLSMGMAFQKLLNGRIKHKEKI